MAQVTGKSMSSPVQENEAILQMRVASLDGSTGLGIASGMRAISVHASDSNGVLNLLYPGQKVDVQVISDPHGAEPRLQAILQNVEVLTIDPAEPNGRPAVTRGRYLARRARCRRSPRFGRFSRPHSAVAAQSS